MSKNWYMIHKKCRPWSDAACFYVWSWSSLFFFRLVCPNLGQIWLSLMKYITRIPVDTQWIIQYYITEFNDKDDTAVIWCTEWIKTLMPYVRIKLLMCTSPFWSGFSIFEYIKLAISSYSVMDMQTAKAQMSLRIRAVWSGPLLSANKIIGQ